MVDLEALNESGKAFQSGINWNNEHNICKLEAVIAEMATGKAPGVDGSPPDVLKVPSLRYLDNILIWCWGAGTFTIGYERLKHHQTLSSKR